MDKNLIRESIHNKAELSFSRSGGPGGQNVNKVNSKATLRININDLEGLSEKESEHLQLTLGPRLSGEGKDTLVLDAEEERSRQRNIEVAYLRAEALITGAARLPKRRRPTRPTRASIERRLESKHHRSTVKEQRKLPDS
jgi:ribosome-associated protein